MTEEVQTTGDEYQLVAEMIAAADKYGLLVEVVVAFGNERSDGLDVATAAANALYEWDI